MKMLRDENGVVMPVKTISAPAENVPPAKIKDKEKIETATAENTEEKTDSKPIGNEEIAKARQTLNEYMSSKKAYDERYKNNFDDYNLLYTENDNLQTYVDDNGERKKVIIPRRTGAQCLNVIMNKHADAMDNFPEAVCLPRSADDETVAKTLNSVLPCVLKRNGFQKKYSDEKIDTFVGGCGAYSATWDPSAENGLGDIAINRCDILSLFWQPHIENIQDSRNLFYVKLFDIDEIKEMYPEKLENVTAENLGLAEFRTYDNNSKQQDKAAVIDWYYKKNGVVHLVKFVGDTILESTENEEATRESGLYEHGLYPFFLDPCFSLRDTPVGFSFVDICRAPQRYLDDLKVDILKNVKVNSQPRNIVNTNTVNLEDLADISKAAVEVDGNADGAIRPIEAKGIAAGALNVYNGLMDEIKETTGTNDASNGASAAGVTSGSAIAALQEAGGKISRDLNKQGYNVFVELCNCVIELMRQFYTLPRFFRITGEENKQEYIQFDNAGLQKQPIVDFSDDEGNPLERLPIFDIDVRAQKASPFATAAQNEMMMELFKMGAFNPEAADATLTMLDGMTFEGKEKLIEKISKNLTLQQAVQDLTNKNNMMAAMLAQKDAQQTGQLAPSQTAQQLLPQAEQQVTPI